MIHPSPGALVELCFDEALEREKPALAAHLRECASCATLVQDMGGIEAALAPGAFEGPPRDGLERVLARVADVRRARARRAEWALAVVPSLAALVAGAWAVRAGGQRLAALGLLPAAQGVSPELLGVSLAALGLVLVGALVTLALAPVLILDSDGRS